MHQDTKSARLIAVGKRSLIHATFFDNSADESSDGSQHSFNTKVKISSDGENQWLAPTIIKSACKINVEYFPFDEQVKESEIKYGKIPYINTYKVALKSSKVHILFFLKSCDVKLGSWTYDTLRLDVQLQNKTADTTKFVSNGEWDLISIKGNRNEFKYPCCSEPYADLTYTIRIRRRTRFYYINLIIPCFVITGIRK